MILVRKLGGNLIGLVGGVDSLPNAFLKIDRKPRFPLP